MDALKEKIKNFIITSKTISYYIVSDIKKKPRTFKIGMFSIYIVVALLVLLQSALDMSSLFFIKIADEQKGEMDLVLQPVSADNDTRLNNANPNDVIIRALNLTEIAQKLSDIEIIQAIYPRWVTPINVSTASVPDINYQAVGIMLNSTGERYQGIGQKLQIPDLGDGQCWITKTLADLLQLNGDEVIVKIDVPSVVSDFKAVSKGDKTEDIDIISMITEKIVNNLVSEDGLRITDLGMEKETEDLNNRIQIMRSALQNSTRPDGTVDMDLFRALLLAAGMSTQQLPPGIFDNVPAPAIEGLLDNFQESLSEPIFNVTRPQMTKFLMPVIRKTLNFTHTYKVVSTIDSSEGKWASDYGNVIVIDSRYIAPTLAKRFFEMARETSINTDNPALDRLLARVIANKQVEDGAMAASYDFDVNQFALYGHVLLKNRAELYLSKQKMRSDIISITNALFNVLGLNYPATVSAPVANALDSFFIFKDFLDNTFMVVTFLLILLSILLIYSLMNANVEEKNYEYGMLRVLGMRKINLILLLTLQSMFFAIPGLLLGFFFAYALNSIISYSFFNYTFLKTSYMLPGSAFAIGLSIGILIPLVSNLLPIQKALSQTLRNSLDVFHRSISDTTITVIKLTKLGISSSQLVGAAILIIVGALTFYLAPYAYIFSDMALFFIVLNIVLMLMIIGLSLLANLMQSLLQRLILRLILLFFCKDKPLGTVTRKNFLAHKNNNQKTSLMFIITMAFLIFAGTGFRLNSNLMKNQLRSLYGSDIVVSALPFETTFLNEQLIRDRLELFRQNFPGILKNYAFVSQPFSLQPQIDGAVISSLPAIPHFAAEIISVDRSYLQSAYEDLYVPTDYDPAVTLDKISNSDLFDGVQALYEKNDLVTINSFDPANIVTAQDRSQIPVNGFIGFQEVRLIIPEGLASDIPIKAGKIGLVTIGSIRFIGRIRNIATKVPGFPFTGYKGTDDTINTILTSHEDYRIMRDIVWNRPTQNLTAIDDIENYQKKIPENSSEGVPKLGLLVKVEEGTDPNSRQMLFNYLQSLITGMYTSTIDVAGMVEVLDNALFFIDLFIILVSIIAVFLSFFFTTVAFVSNVRENLWEFGILKSLGLSKKQMSKTYIFEAISVVTAGIILGTVVGIIAAVMVSKLFGLFTEFPLEFMFPLTIFLVTIIASIITAVIASKIAVDKVKHKQISTIIKSLE